MRMGLRPSVVDYAFSTSFTQMHPSSQTATSQAAPLRSHGMQELMSQVEVLHSAELEARKQAESALAHARAQLAQARSERDQARSERDQARTELARANGEEEALGAMSLEQLEALAQRLNEAQPKVLKRLLDEKVLEERRRITSCAVCWNEPNAIVFACGHQVMPEHPNIY